MSTFARAAGHGLNADRSEMPATENGSIWPQCRPERYGWRLTIAWQRDMLVNPVGQRSGSSTIDIGAGQTHKIGIISI